MNSKLSASLLLAAAVITVLAPVCMSGSDAVTEDDFELIIPNSGVEEGVPLEIENGDNYIIAMYFINNSEHLLDVDVDVVYSVKEVRLEEKPQGVMLMPQGDPDHKDVFRQTMTVVVDEVCPSYSDATIDVYVNVTDLSDLTKLYYSFTIHLMVYSSYDTAESYNNFFWIFPNTLSPPLDSPVVPFVVTMAALAAIALLISLAVVPAVARKLDSYTPGNDGTRFRRILSAVVTVSVIAVSLGPALGILGADLSIQLPAARISTAVFIAILAVAVWKVYSMVIEGILARYEKKEVDSSIDLSMLPLFLMLGKLVLWIVSTALILSTFGVDLQGVLISAGIVTLGITLGAQNVLSQFFSGLVLLITRPFEAGDILIINGNTLRVKKVKVMFTEFTSRYNDRVITMPNNAVTAATIVNHDKEEKSHYIQVTIPVPYGTDLKKAMEVITKVTDESPYVVHDPKLRPQSIKLIEFQDSGMLMELSTNVISFDTSFEIASRLRMAMYEALKEAGIVVPYSRLEVTMLNDCFNEKQES
jgi:small-conductance mechanosensitive channel